MHRISIAALFALSLAAIVSVLRGPRRADVATGAASGCLVAHVTLETDGDPYEVAEAYRREVAPAVSWRMGEMPNPCDPLDRVLPTKEAEAAVRRAVEHLLKVEGVDARLVDVRLSAVPYRSRARIRTYTVDARDEDPA